MLTSGIAQADERIVAFGNSLGDPDSFEDPMGNDNLNTDAGVRATIVGALFTRSGRAPARLDAGSQQRENRHALSHAVGDAF